MCELVRDRYFESCSSSPFLVLVDDLHNTAGDIALSMNNESCYRLIRDAGIRSGESCLPSFRFEDLLKAACSELLLDLISFKPSLPLSIILKAEDDTATGSTEAFLSSKLHYTRDEHGQEICLLHEGDRQIGVMMGWEREISEYRSLRSS